MWYVKAKTKILAPLVMALLTGCSTSSDDYRIQVAMPETSTANRARAREAQRTLDTWGPLAMYSGLSTLSFGSTQLTAGFALESMTTAPTTIDDFDCFALNITGDGIPTNAVMGSCSAAQNMDYPGIVIGTFPAQGQQIEALVPGGSGRKFQLWAAKSNVGYCPDLSEAFGDHTSGQTQSLDQPYLLAETVVDVLGDTSVNLYANFDPADPKKIECNDHGGGDHNNSDPSDYFGGGQMVGIKLKAWAQRIPSNTCEMVYVRPLNSEGYRTYASTGVGVDITSDDITSGTPTSVYSIYTDPMCSGGIYDAATVGLETGSEQTQFGVRVASIPGSSPSSTPSGSPSTTPSIGPQMFVEFNAHAYEAIVTPYSGPSNTPSSVSSPIPGGVDYGNSSVTVLFQDVPVSYALPEGSDTLYSNVCYNFVTRTYGQDGYPANNFNSDNVNYGSNSPANVEFYNSPNCSPSGGPSPGPTAQQFIYAGANKFQGISAKILPGVATVALQTSSQNGNFGPGGRQFYVESMPAPYISGLTVQAGPSGVPAPPGTINTDGGYMTSSAGGLMLSGADFFMGGNSNAITAFPLSVPSPYPYTCSSSGGGGSHVYPMPNAGCNGFGSLPVGDYDVTYQNPDGQVSNAVSLVVRPGAPFSTFVSGGTPPIVNWNWVTYQSYTNIQIEQCDANMGACDHTDPEYSSGWTGVIGPAGVNGGTPLGSLTSPHSASSYQVDQTGMVVGHNYVFRLKFVVTYNGNTYESNYSLASGTFLAQCSVNPEWSPSNKHPNVIVDVPPMGTFNTQARFTQPGSPYNGAAFGMGNTPRMSNSGKTYYFEIYLAQHHNSDTFGTAFGIATSALSGFASTPVNGLGDLAEASAWVTNNSFSGEYNLGILGSSLGASLIAPETIGVAVNLTGASPVITYYKNGTQQGPGNLSTGLSGSTFYPAYSISGQNGTETIIRANFGSSAFNLNPLPGYMTPWCMN